MLTCALTGDASATPQERVDQGVTLAGYSYMTWSNDPADAFGAVYGSVAALWSTEGEAFTFDQWAEFATGTIKPAIDRAAG
jgi:hypothetical protein